MITLCECGIFEKVDHLDPVHAFQVLLADLLEVRERSEGFRRLPRHVKPQLPRLAFFLLALSSSILLCRHYLFSPSLF